MPATLIKRHEEHGAVEYKTADGLTFFNAKGGEKGTQVYSSGELGELSKLGLNQESLNDPFFTEMRAEFGATLIEVIPTKEVATDA